MTAKRGVAETGEPGEGASPPVDLAHLERQTLGNRALQAEVLRLFLDQLSDCVARIGSAASPGERREAAHLLAGSARGVGAFTVAGIATGIEQADGPLAERLAALDAAAAAARSFIAAHLAA